jgi:phosphotriesterase-related protein
MGDRELAGKVQTVLGIITPGDLGVTLPHEHLLMAGEVYFKEPDSASEKKLAYQPVNMENLSWIRYHMKDNLDNLRLLDEEVATREAMMFKLAGGQTITDLTIVGLGRDPLALARISRVTGLNIVMGSGYYIEATYPQGFLNDKTESGIAEEIIHDITVGVDDTGICSGMIGELGCSWPLGDGERKVLRAGAIAQQETGAAINIHPGRNERAPLEIIEVLIEAGADINRVVMSHIDRTGFLRETRCKLAESGCYLEYDQFGWEGYYPARVALADDHMPDLPNDVQRIKEIRELIDMGYLKQILLSHDICYKTRLVTYGGEGYAHLLHEVLPLMRIYGISDEEIRTMVEENPGRILQFI